MKKYVVLLRGINVGGKNKLAMSALKSAFEELGFFDVRTYINSGNILFSSEIADQTALITSIQNKIESDFHLKIPVMVLAISELKEILAHAPSWWGSDDKTIYDNAIFVLPPTTTEEVVAIIGETKDEIEQVAYYRNVIFWSAALKTFNKTSWAKISSSTVNRKVTVRNANTTRKLLALAEDT